MNNKLRITTLTAACLSTLFACAVQQPMSGEEVIQEALPETTQVLLNFQEAASAAAGSVTNGWLKSFNDPELEALVKEAIQNNLTLRAAVAKVDAAAGLATQAGAELQPVIAAGGKAERIDGGGRKRLDSHGVGMNMSWEVDLWGRVRSQAQAGQAAFEGSQHQLEWLYQSIAAQTAKTWFLVTEVKLQLELAQEALALYEKTLSLVQSQYKQGRVTQGDVALVRASVAQGEATVRQATGAWQQVSRALEVILGRYPAAEIEGADEFVAVPPPIPVGIPSELLERRPDLRAAERSIAAQFLTIETAKAARLPRVSLTAGVGSSSSELSDILSLGSDYWSIGSNFMAPVFTGGFLKAQVDIESARLQGALANYGQLALRAFSEVEQGLSNETLLREREFYLQEVINESRESLRVATRQFEVGRAPLLAVLQQQGIVISGQVNLLNIQDQRLQQRVDLHLALGGGFQKDNSP